MTDTARQILRIERQQVADFNRGRIPALLRSFDPSFVGFSSTRQPRIAGRNALSRTFHFYLKQAPKLAYSIVQPRVQVYGRAAVATFYWKVRLGKRSINGRGSHVYVKKPAGWRIVHEHFSRAH